MRRLTKITPYGEIELARWNAESLGAAELQQIEAKFNVTVAEGYIPACTLEKSDQLIRWFNPNVDIVMVPAIQGGGLQTFQETLVSQSVAGAAFGTFTTAKTVLPATSLITLPGNWFYIGRAINVKIRGAIGNLVTTPGLMNFQVKIGGAVGFDTGNIQLNATAHTTLPFWLDIDISCRAIGSGTSANLMGLAMVCGKMFTTTAGQTDSAQDMPSIIAPATAPVVGSPGFDSTIANILDLFVGFTISNAANTVRIDQYLVTAQN